MMKKKIYYSIALLMICVVSVLSSCSDSKTYAELLADEKTAIKNFKAQEKINPVSISKNKLSDIISKYSKALEALKEEPGTEIYEDLHPFDANTWYEFETYEGLCVNFKNFGAEEKFSSRDQVGIRYKYYNLLTFEDHETSSYISNIDFSQNLTVITDWVTNLYYGSDYGSGITFPIQFIGTEAEVSLIVPSKVGNASDISSVVPLYYETITYYETYQD